ncbi:MAG: hypothetical protein COV44_11810 [Deltaproteobacteria bacterium CG11_big_fil_rev_8_21_14_0_20_45_16]|nr:MAG: hypothetical protein COV44_11810 [Deltaproteobacteria bacterium CG11_big_fil_rev_8_21_14_0_20_45_16]
MCGRFSTPDEELVIKKFGLKLPDGYRRSFNVAPTQPVLTMVSKKELQLHRWGLIPSWAKDSSIGNKMINARAETVAEKPAFRKPFAKRRCLVLAAGFYEWQRLNDTKRPHYIYAYDGDLITFAGIWDEWKIPEGELVRSACIITTAANDFIKPIHDRMPVVIRSEELDEWLNPDADPVKLTRLLRSPPDGFLKAHSVSKFVNHPRNDSEKCIEPESIATG